MTYASYISILLSVIHLPINTSHNQPPSGNLIATKGNHFRCENWKQFTKETLHFNSLKIIMVYTALSLICKFETLLIRRIHECGFKGKGRILGWNQVSVSFLIYEILFVMDKVSNILTKTEYVTIRALSY